MTKVNFSIFDVVSNEKTVEFSKRFVCRSDAELWLKENGFEPMGNRWAKFVGGTTALIQSDFEV